MVRLALALVVLIGAPACSGDDDPCAEPGSCALEPLRPVAFQGLVGAMGVSAVNRVAALGAIRLTLVDPATGQPFAPPFTVDVDSPDFTATLEPPNTVLLESVRYDAAVGLTGTVRIRTTDGRTHGMMAVTAEVAGPPRLVPLGEASPTPPRLLAFTAGVPADLLAMLYGTGALFDQRMTVTTTGAVSSTPIAWDGVTVVPPATGTVTLTVTSAGTGVTPMPIGVSAGATGIDTQGVQHAVVDRQAIVCAVAVDAGGRQVLGLDWTWRIADGSATLGPASQRNCKTLLTSSVGTIHLDVAVPGAAGVVEVEVSPHS